MTKKEKEKIEAIERIRAGLQCTQQEAEEVYNCDCQIDQDIPHIYFDLPPKKQEVARKFAHTGTRERKAPTIYKFDKRERKPNATKDGIITDLHNYLKDSSGFVIEGLQVPNKEQKISFKIGDKWYTLTLTEHRKLPAWIKE